jgi:hypothetical protein
VLKGEWVAQTLDQEQQSSSPPAEGQDGSFASITAKGLGSARAHPGIKRFAEFSRRYLDRLRREERIDS